MDWQILRNSANLIALISYAEEMGYPLRDVLWGTGIDAVELEQSGQEVTTWQEIMALRNLAKLDYAPESMGLRIGQRVSPGRLRMLGMAMITSATLGEALDRLKRLAPLGLSFGRFVPERTEEFYHLALVMPPLPDDILPLIVQRGLGGAAGLYTKLTGQKMIVRECHLMQPEPADPTPFIQGLCENLTFGAESNFVRFDPDIWQIPLPNADPITARMCEDIFMQAIRDRKARNGLTGDLLMSLQSRPTQLPDMESMARDLGITERTLRRRLSSEGTSYREIIDQVRAERADLLLSNKKRTIDKIASDLGFSDPASFVRAYRRWHGKTPRAK